MLGIIATEAAEAAWEARREQERCGLREPPKDEPSFECSLRLVRGKDGSLRWED